MTEKYLQNITYPKVSICMPTYNRNEFFELMKYNLINFVYPDKSLLEWVIDDDGTDKLFKNQYEIDLCEKEIFPITINYKHYKVKRGIGQKRNAMVKQANYRHLAMMDSDDAYMPSYIQYSIETMIQGNFSLVGSPQMIFLYPNNDFKLSCIQCSDKRQIHEATMVFKKTHWRSMKGFEKSSQGEGAKMVDFNDGNCGKTECHLCMICICHKNNTIDKDRFINANKVEGKIAKVLLDILCRTFNVEANDYFKV